MVMCRGVRSGLLLGYLGRKTYSVHKFSQRPRQISKRPTYFPTFTVALKKFAQGAKNHPFCALKSQRPRHTGSLRYCNSANKNLSERPWRCKTMLQVKEVDRQSGKRLVIEMPPNLKMSSFTTPDVFSYFLNHCQELAERKQCFLLEVYHPSEIPQSWMVRRSVVISSNCELIGLKLLNNPNFSICTLGTCISTIPVFG